MFQLLVLSILFQIDPDTFEAIRQVALILAFVLEGGLVVPIVKQIKSRLNLTGWSSLLWAVVVSALFGFATAVADGAITGESFAWSNLSNLFTAVFLFSQVVYRMLKDKGSADSS